MEKEKCLLTTKTTRPRSSYWLVLFATIFLVCSSPPLNHAAPSPIDSPSRNTANAVFQAAGNVLHVGVGQTYSAIQAAIDAAVSGDTVLVHDGQYRENINFSGKAISVRSQNGADFTTINGNAGGSVVRFLSGEKLDSVLDGFTLTGGTGYVPYDALVTYGGGIYCNASSPTITNCIIRNNTATYMGGGIFCEKQSSPLIRNCAINNNQTLVSTSWGGGGIACFSSSSPEIAFCTISNNYTPGPGGGIFAYNASWLKITNCTISNNSAASGGGLCGDYYASFLINNSLISRNTAMFSGGGIIGRNASVELINATITGNAAAAGGGVSVSFTWPKIVNSILWGDKAGGAVSELVIANGTAEITFSDIEGMSGGTGNISSDPRFVDPVGGNYHLRLDSPCIDTGTATGAPALDIDGDSRPQGLGIDMGYDEQACMDTDADGVCAFLDNCPDAANADQSDRDHDGLGDVCDPCPDDPANDADGDGLCANADNCPAIANVNQADSDGDGVGDACDNCRSVVNAEQADDDGDGVGNVCDSCPNTVNPAQTDGDSDGLGDVCDNCPVMPNANQNDRDGDGIGDACDPCPDDPDNDRDGDGRCGNVDNCPDIANPSQADRDGDGIGDACDSCPDDPGNDADGDGACDNIDNCLALANPDQADRDGDGIGDACDNENMLHVASIYETYTSIQTAINAAVSGDTIIVHDGEYPENLNLLGKAITLRSQNGAESTILWGILGSDSVVTFASGEGNGTILDGFTISKYFGTATYGGGIRCTNASSPTIRNCVIKGCRSTSGGGIWCYDSSSPIIDHCIITGNSGTGSFASYGGGGIACSKNSNPLITHCTISNNSGSGGTTYGGGGISCSWSAPTIRNCTISGNSSIHGGGIAIDGPSSALIANCIISNNKADGMPTSEGGGIYSNGATPVITHCTISGNHSLNGVSGGLSFNSSTPVITNCVITGNSASHSVNGLAGGLYFKSSAATITNCTISGNRNVTAGKAGGVFCSSSNPKFTNTILWGNTTAGIRNDIFMLDTASAVTVTFSDIDPAAITGAGARTLTNNINADPLFAAPSPAAAAPTSAGDYHLLAASPCINTGTPTGAPADDIDGDSRPQGTGHDMGADEFFCPDSDGDGLCPYADNCPTAFNPDQTDTDLDGMGDACDPCPGDAQNDSDGDGICGNVDNCPNLANSDQADVDGDGVGDVCDNCPQNANQNQSDTDRDGVGDACDSCPLDHYNDSDGDGVCGDVDNCRGTPNSNQADTDGDGVGDACDNCPVNVNTDQADNDLDGIGDVCDPFNLLEVGISGYPYSSIQAAIDRAIPGTTVLVHDGTYVERINFLGKAIIVRSEHGPEHTVINGNQAGSVVTFATGETVASVLEGFTITNGLAEEGAGIYCNGGSSPTISNCNITNNTLVGGYSYGGGIFCNNASSPIIIGSVISNNIPSHAYGNGSVFSRGGGIYLANHSSPIITRCTISNNSVANEGGGLYINNGSPTVTDCTINDNQAWAIGTADIFGAGGGGIWVENATPSITGCVISGNLTNWAGGGISFRNSSSVVASCIITGNRVTREIVDDSISYGGGVALRGSSVVIANSTISGNHTSYFGGGIACWSSLDSYDPFQVPSSLTVINSILYGNMQTYMGQSINWDIFINPASTMNSDHSIISSVYPGIANFYSDPLFVNARPGLEAPTSAGDYHLLATSPAIDRGTDAAAPNPVLPNFDIDGDSRPQGIAYDIGADEIPCSEADADGDGYTECRGDCNDADPSVHPGAPEICGDGIDNNCNFQIDENKVTFWRDLDGDGYGHAAYETLACAGVPPAGYVANQDDCDDMRRDTHPGAGEICDGADNNCDGQRDEGLPVFTFYRDADGDSFGTTAAAINACARPGGYVTDNTDCDDTRVDVHPGVPEICDLLDNNCDGYLAVDEVNDADLDGLVDCLDPCPSDPANDSDGDGICGAVDNCPAIANPGQADSDGDGIGDACDNCPNDPNSDQADTNGNGVGDVCDQGGPRLLEVGKTGYPYTTIQAAINAAAAGDTVLVHDGTYVENLDFIGKAITVRSANGAAVTIVNGNAQGSVVLFITGEGAGSVLDGFTLTGGSGRAGVGGGIHCVGSSPVITNCIITNNTVSSDGGGIYCNAASPTITATAITNNRAAKSGAGLLLSNASAPLISNCLIDANTANERGGIFIDHSSPTITDTTISNNVASGWDGGGVAMYLSSPAPVFTNCVISGNRATRNGGGLASYTSSPVITNCAVTNNRSGASGGGLYFEASSPEIMNAVVLDNTSGSNGAGLFIGYQATTPTLVVNSILRGNKIATTPNEIALYQGGAITITYSDIQGGYAGVGNIDADPRFVGAGDYHLGSDSPCIDAGTSDTAAYPDLPDEDIDGQIRPQGARHDMGMDEYSLTPVDQDGDGYPAGIDCNDLDPAINPGAVEECSDGVDNNCNGLIDGADPACPAPAKYSYYFPAIKDNDAIGWENYLTVQAKEPVSMEVTLRVYDMEGVLQGTYIYSNSVAGANAPALAPNARVALRPSGIAGGAVEGSVVVETSVPAIASTNCIANYYKGFSIYEAAKARQVHNFPKAYDGPAAPFFQVYMLAQNIYDHDLDVTVKLLGKTAADPGHGATKTYTIPAHGTLKVRPGEVAPLDAITGKAIDFSGSVVITADLAIPAMCRFEAGAEALAIYESTVEQQGLFFPVIKDGKFGGALDYQNFVSVVNPSATASATITLVLYNKAGTEEARLANIAILPGGKKTWRPSWLKGTLALPKDFEGSIVVTTDIPVVGQTNTIYPGPNPYGADGFDLLEASMPAPMLFFPKVYDNLLGSGTGATHLTDNFVYVQNPDATARNVVIDLYNSNGSLNRTTTVAIVPYATHVFRPKDLVTDGSGVFRGSVRVTEQNGLPITGGIKYEVHKTTSASAGIEAMTIYRSMGQ